MPLISTVTASKLEAGMIAFIASQPGSGFDNSSVIETIMDADFQLGTPSMPSVLLAPPAGTFRLPRSTSMSNPMDIGLECARYWSLANDPGAPSVLSSIVGISNDASKIAGPIAANLTALSSGSTMLMPSYAEFIDCIYREVKTIIWSVTETSGPSTTTYTVTVS